MSDGSLTIPHVDRPPEKPSPPSPRPRLVVGRDRGDTGHRGARLHLPLPDIHPSTQKITASSSPAESHHLARRGRLPHVHRRQDRVTGTDIRRLAPKGAARKSLQPQVASSPLRVLRQLFPARWNFYIASILPSLIPSGADC